MYQSKECEKSVVANRYPQQHIRNIDLGVYFAVQYHPGLPDIKGTLKTFLPMLYTSELMSMVFFRPPVVCSPNKKTFLNKYVGPNFRSLRKKPS